MKTVLSLLVSMPMLIASEGAFGVSPAEADGLKSSTIVVKTC